MQIDFIKYFEKKWLNYGNVSSTALRDTWYSNCKTMDNVIRDNKQGKAIKYVVSAVTGSAKTENIISYVSLLKDTKALIVTNLISEADRLASDINKESNTENKAIASHSKNSYTDKEVVDYQILIVTHEFYKQNYTGTDKWNLLTDDRDLIVIDEALDTAEELSVSSREIDKLIAIFSTISIYKRYEEDKILKAGVELLQINLTMFDDLRNEFGKGTILANSEQAHKLPRMNFLVPIINHLRVIICTDKKLSFSQILTGRKSDSDRNIKKDILSHLNVLEQLQGNQIFITSNRGVDSYHMVKDTVPNKSLVCFDATSNVSETYKLRAKYHKDLILIPKIDGVRNYDNATIYTALAKTGKGHYSSVDAATDIYNNVLLGEKTLVVTHKESESYFMQAVPKGEVVEVAHWGALTGLNKWQDFDTIIVVGLNHKRPSHSQSNAIINTHEEIAFGELQNSINDKIKITDLISEMIQAINRIRVRKAIDENGRCKTASIYITLPVYKSEEYIHIIKENMPHAKFNEWEFQTSISKNEKTTGHFPNIISYLDGNMKQGEEVSIYEPRNELSIANDSYSRIIGKRDFIERMKMFGYEIISRTECDKRGRVKKKPSRYIYKI